MISWKGKKGTQRKLIRSNFVWIHSLVKSRHTGRRVCRSHQFSAALITISITIFTWYESPVLPLHHVTFRTWVSPIGCPNHPPKPPPLSGRWRGNVTKLRFKEAKLAFMSNYANHCSEIGVETLSPKIAAKLPFSIGNLFQVSHLIPNGGR